MFEFTGYTQKYFTKEKNGDHFILEDISEEKTLIAIVSDGVGGRPCDWQASKITCNDFITFFRKNKDVALFERIELSINQLNDSLKKKEGICEGMRSTLSLIVWPYNESNCFMVNIGDSRVYKKTKDNLIQLSIDDIERNSSKITNALGMATIKISIKEIPFLKHQSLVLASDGFYTANSNKFEDDIIKICAESNVKDAIVMKFKNYFFTARDDMTVVIIKN